jgi:hypothetical protein
MKRTGSESYAESEVIVVPRQGTAVQRANGQFEAAANKFRHRSPKKLA